MADIFLSYASADRAKARSLDTFLKAKSYSVFWDRESIPVGWAFDDFIEKELRDTKAVIVLWSKFATASRWVRIEAKEALERGILVPATIEKIEQQTIPLEFRHIHSADLSSWDFCNTNLEVERLLEAVDVLIGNGGRNGPVKLGEGYLIGWLPRRLLLPLIAIVLFIVAGTLWVFLPSPDGHPTSNREERGQPLQGSINQKSEDLKAGLDSGKQGLSPEQESVFDGKGWTYDIFWCQEKLPFSKEKALVIKKILESQLNTTVRSKQWPRAGTIDKNGVYDVFHEYDIRVTEEKLGRAMELKKLLDRYISPKQFELQPVGTNFPNILSIVICPSDSKLDNSPNVEPGKINEKPLENPAIQSEVVDPQQQEIVPLLMQAKKLFDQDALEASLAEIEKGLEIESNNSDLLALRDQVYKKLDEELQKTDLGKFMAQLEKGSYVVIVNTFDREEAALEYVNQMKLQYPQLFYPYIRAEYSDNNIYEDISGHHVVFIGGLYSQASAEKLKGKAIRLGFRKDSFIVQPWGKQ